MVFRTIWSGRTRTTTGTSHTSTGTKIAGTWTSTGSRMTGTATIVSSASETRFILHYKVEFFIICLCQPPIIFPINKGTHKALNRFRGFAYKAGKNNTRTCWVLKCDIRKFFANIDQETLLDILNSYIPDKQIIW